MSHLTAIARRKLSVPVRWLSGNNLLIGRCLDYGCGRGFDADELGMDKYDPYYFPEEPTGKYTTIVCTYVLNVISQEDQEDVIRKIRALLEEGGKAYLTVRRDIPKEGKPGKGCFQRYVVLDYNTLKRNSSFEIYEICDN